MILRTWRAVSRSVFSIRPEEATPDAVCTGFEARDQSRGYRAERLEAKAIAAKKRELQTSYSRWGVNRYRARVAALAERERALIERMVQRRAKEAADLEAAIQAINEGRWSEEEGKDVF